MRNPWMDFPSVPLGRIFEKVGGGGHQRVGSVELRSDQFPATDDIRLKLLDEMKRAELQQRAERSHD